MDSIDWACEAYRISDDLVVTLAAGRATYRVAADTLTATIAIQLPVLRHDLDGDGRDEAIVIAAHTNEAWAGIYYCAYLFALDRPRPRQLDRLLLGATAELRLEGGALHRPDGCVWRWNGRRLAK